ncbi:hypothetical protein P4K96_01065 [Bacillus cereus]|uniref:hypothetical protein n=1 Tax=Paenibacillus melissococcoides TaxID=2912268 RepID=UPI002DC96EAD|nr:hypothetical protein [Bacillus cereus]
MKLKLTQSKRLQKGDSIKGRYKKMPELMETYVQKKAEEYLDRCCKRRKMFYQLFAIFYHEALHVKPALADALLEIEEMMIDSISDIKEAFSAGFKECAALSECEKKRVSS